MLHLAVDGNMNASRRFNFVRTEDVSGVSGTGVVGEGVEFTNGKVCFTWHSSKSSVAIYDNIKTFISVHGHEGKGNIEWVDEDHESKSTN